MVTTGFRNSGQNNNGAAFDLPFFSLILSPVFEEHVVGLFLGQRLDESSATWRFVGSGTE